jgi:hypothetical protein
MPLGEAVDCDALTFAAVLTIDRNGAVSGETLIQGNPSVYLIVDSATPFKWVAPALKRIRVAVRSLHIIIKEPERGLVTVPVLLSKEPPKAGLYGIGDSASLPHRSVQLHLRADSVDFLLEGERHTFPVGAAPKQMLALDTSYLVGGIYRLTVSLDSRWSHVEAFLAATVLYGMPNETRSRRVLIETQAGPVGSVRCRRGARSAVATRHRPARP